MATVTPGPCRSLVGKRWASQGRSEGRLCWCHRKALQNMGGSFGTLGVYAMKGRQAGIATKSTVILCAK